MPKLLFLPVLAAAIALASITSLLPAEGHSRPIRFDPAPGAVLNSAPAQVTGWFTADIRRADESFIKVVAPDGAEVNTGDVELSADRRQMSTALQSGLGMGRYLVHWSTFDDEDGAVYGECYVFFVGQAAADAAIESRQRIDGGADCPAVDEGHSHGAPTHSASVAISIPSTVDGSEATLEITPTNFTPRAPGGNSPEAGFGHYHIYLDKVPVDILTGDHSHDEDDDHGAGSSGHDDADKLNPGGLAENPVMWVENRYTFTNLEPGFHTVTVVLNYDDHTPYDPPVIATQTLFVEGGGDADGGVPAWTLALAAIAGLVAGGVGVRLAGNRA